VLGQETTFRVTNLAPGAKYRVLMDGQEYQDWQLREHKIQVRTTVGTHSIIIQQHAA